MRSIAKSQAGLGKITVIVAIAVVAAVIVSILFSKAQKQGTIKIGAILSLTGPGAYYGKEVRDGLLLAIDEANTWGGINGSDIELIVEDCETSPERAVEAFKRIEAHHHPALYVSTLSSVSAALAPLAEKSKVVLVALVATAAEITKQKAWVFRYWINPEQEITAVLSILRMLKVESLGMLYLDDEYGNAISDSLKQEFEEIGVSVRHESFDLKAVSFKSQIRNLKHEEALYVVGYGSHFKNIFRQLREEDFRGSIIASTGAADPPVRAIPEANGIFATAPLVYDSKYVFAQKARKMYTERNKKPFNPFSATGYDTIKLLTGLLEEKEVSRSCVRCSLEAGFMHPGVLGNLEAGSGVHDIVFPVYPVRIVNGKVIYLR